MSNLRRRYSKSVPQAAELEVQLRTGNEQLCALMTELTELAVQLRQSATEMRQMLAAKRTDRVSQPMASRMEN